MEKSLNAIYYACSYAKVDYFRFINVTASMALKLISERLKPQSVFLCIDDTIAAKFGKKFKDVSSFLTTLPRMAAATQPTGRKSRPARHGMRLSTESDFTLSNERIGDYYIGVIRILTNLLFLPM